MEEDSSGQSQPAALSEEQAGEPNGSGMLTVRETDDQEMGLAVAILELIGSQPHAQVGTFGKCFVLSLDPLCQSRVLM